MKRVCFLLLLSLVLAACNAAPQAVSITALPGSPTSQPVPTTARTPVEANPAPSRVPSEAGQSYTAEDLIRIDEQGAIAVEVRPVNLNNPGEALEFEVGLNTHSVDLSMDLATLAALTTDTGRTVRAGRWDAPLGGHHVSGKLIFPAMIDGQPLLEGATQLTLAIKDLDAAERVFAWDLNP